MLAGGDAAAALQHVAFACARRARRRPQRMAERGAPPLAIPDNYYDDLAARPEPRAASCSTQLRELGVLYDRDARGELLHFYTPPVAGRLFFEVVERRGGYDGYGAANAPVRMAAQRRPDASATTSR